MLRPIAPHMLRAKIWIGGLGLAVFMIAVAVMQVRAMRKEAPSPNGLGLDFIAFYQAGTFVREGHADRLYDLAATRASEHSLAVRENLPLGDKIGPFFNPPLVAWMFAPLSALDYRDSLHLWWVINLTAYTGATILLCRMVPAREGGRDWRDWALVPLLMSLSMPFVQALGHGQNTCLSLLILAATVSAWRARRGLLAGIFASLLFYKPQLGAIVLGAIIIDLGRTALISSIAALGTLVSLNLLTLPGTLTDYARRLGPNVTETLATHPYVMQRHATMRAFWHLLLADHSPRLALGLTLACSIALAVALVVRLLVHRGGVHRDRSIAAVIIAAPLLMPYYMDYDLLLLSVPAVLIASEWIDGRTQRVWELRVWIAMVLLLMINAGLTGAIHVNLAIPLLAIMAFFRLSTRPVQNPWETNRLEGWCPPSRMSFATPSLV